MARLSGRPLTDVVDAVLGQSDRAPAVPPYLSAVPSPSPGGGLLRLLSQEERRARRRLVQRDGVALKAWWLDVMGRTEAPVLERMVLFWHGHFTSSLRKVVDPALLAAQNALFRRHALGSFRSLLAGVLRDPAMLVYLDNHRNVRRKPNENLARELFELFTLGEGHYQESDVREAARALTGRGVDRAERTLRDRWRQHDDGDKTILGRSGPWNADDLVDILLGQPRTAELLTEKAWRTFVGPAPQTARAAGEVGGVARVLRESGWQIRPWLRALLLTPSFMETSNRGCQVKSPVELVVSTPRMLGVPPPPGEVLARVVRDLGQDVFDPPNVRGWPGGERWITSHTLLGRRQLMLRVVEELEDRGAGAGPSPAVDLGALLVGPPARPLPSDGSARIAATLLDPAFQLC